MSDAIVQAVDAHPAPEGLQYTYGTAGVSEYALEERDAC